MAIVMYQQLCIIFIFNYQEFDLLFVFNAKHFHFETNLVQKKFLSVHL